MDKNTEVIPEPYFWLASANVENDILSYSEKGDYRLIAIANRGSTIVGLNESDNAENLKAQCGVRFLQGLGDVIKPTEKPWRDKAVEYAKAYNFKMKMLCLDQPPSKGS